MRWEDYYNTYQSYELSVNQSRVLTVVAKEALKDFPTNLPSSVSKPLRETMRQVQNALELAEPKSKEQVTPSRIEIDVGDTHEVVKAVLPMYLGRANLGASADDVDFQRVLYSQELGMLFAHLDAFMSDSLETVCRVRPEVMKSDRKKEWNSILSCGGWEELLDQMIDQYAFRFGWQPVSKRVEFLRKEIGLTIDCGDSSLDFISDAENFRHVVLHNAGRANEDFVKKVRHCGLSAGDVVPLTPTYLSSVSAATRRLAAGTFIGVSKKFFGKNDSEIKGVWRERSI